LLIPNISASKSPEILAITSIACGLVSLGKNDNQVPTSIINAMIELSSNDPDALKSPYMKLTGLGVALCYYGARDDIEVPSNAMEVLPEPFKSVVQTLLLMCSYAGTGDVLIVQELLALVGEKMEAHLANEGVKPVEKEKPIAGKGKKAKKVEWDWTAAEAVATLAVASVSFGEDIGKLWRLGFIALSFVVLLTRIK